MKIDLETLKKALKVKGCSEEHIKLVITDDLLPDLLGDVHITMEYIKVAQEKGYSNLFVYGPPGRGLSTILTWVLRKHLEQGKLGRKVSYSSIRDYMDENYGKMPDKFKHDTLIIVDDIHKDDSRHFLKFISWVKTRINAGVTIVLGSNVDSTTFPGEVSGFINRYFVPIRLQGEDIRSKRNLTLEEMDAEINKRF